MSTFQPEQSGDPDSPDLAARHRLAASGGASSLRISGPADLIAAMPYLIGFHPQQSLVLVAIDERNLVIFTARVDLADLDMFECGRSLRLAVINSGAAALVAIIVATDALSVPAEVSLACSCAMSIEAETATELLDVMACDGVRWRSLLCDDATCCRPEGTLLPALDDTEIAASATLAGMVALPSRDAMRALLAGSDDAEREMLRVPVRDRIEADESSELPWRRSRVRALFAACRNAEAVPGQRALLAEGAQLVDLAAALNDVEVRDSVWLAVDDGRLPGRALWRELAARMPAPYDAPALFLLAWSSWRAGEATFAGMAVERALESDPGYSAADLLLAVLNGGIDPGRLPKLNGGGLSHRPRRRTA